MVSLNSTSLSDARSFIFTARCSVNRIGFALLIYSLFLTPIRSQVLINEVITDPQVDWSTNAFDGTNGGGTIDSNDEWIELYISANGLDLTGWTIEMNDGTNASGAITAGAAFVTMNYISGTGGSFTDTDAGDYLIIGQPNGSSMDATVTVVLRDNTSTLIDQVEIAAGSGTMFTGTSTGIVDESVCRIPNGQDTDIESDDFVLTQATLGGDNSPTGTVLINEIITDPQQDWQGVGFASTPGVIGGNTQGTDEWIELYIGTTGLNLTKWIIDVNDGASFSGDLTARDVTGNGAFQEIVYSGAGSFTSTVAGDYLVLGNPQGSESMNNEVTVTLTDPYGTSIDIVEVATGSGTGFDGNANDLDDESVCRIPNGQDTDVEAVDFVQTRATIGANNSPTGTVIINEVVTSPQQDWSASGFTDPEPGGTAGSNDEWIELYIGSSGLNLIKWIISVQDGSDFSGDLTSAGAFTVVNYVGAGSFNNTVAGDYLILGNPTSTEEINNDVYITLTDPYGTMVDDVEIGDDAEGDGNGDGAADGSASGGLSSGIADESIFRVPLAQDTDDDVADFRQGLASLGLENGIIYVDASAPDDTGFGRPGDPKQLIQSGLDIVVEDGQVIVAAGTYNENLTISNPMTLRGANVGVDGNDAGRVAETIIEPATQSNAIVINSDSVTIDGFQIGTTNADAAISASGSSYLNIQYNVINADSVGVGITTATEGYINVTSNLINANDFTTGLGNVTSSLTLAGLTGDVDVNLSDNEHTGSALGVFVFDCLSSNVLSIANDTTTSSIRGISVFSYNGVTRASSTILVDGFSASSFAEPGGGITNFPEAGIYFYTDGLSDNTHLITATVNNSSFSDVENTTSDYAGIICGDFSGTDYTEFLQDITITECTFDSNENRGFYARGQNTQVAIARSTFTNNGFDPFGGGGNFGFNIVVREGAQLSATNCYLTNPASQTSSQFDGLSMQSGVGSSLVITDSYFDQNGNGQISSTAGIDLSGNYFGTTTETTIDGFETGSDFTPYLASGTDTDLGTPGFQGDFNSLIVTNLGGQTSGERIEEGVSLVNAGGTVTVNASTYAETPTISKSVNLYGANQGTAGNDGGRVTETIIDPGSADVGLTIGSSDVTVDGFQFGTDNANSNLTTAINNTGFAGFTATNNRIHSNGVGVLLAGLTSGTNTISDNLIEMLNLEDPLTATNPSIGIYTTTISGTADVDLTDNDISVASYGILGFSLTSAVNMVINGGNITGCTKGIEVDNADGTGNYSPSTIVIQDVVMSGFTGPDADVVAPDAQAGIYLGAFSTLVSGSATDADDLTAAIVNVDISGVSNTANDYSAIYVADFNSGEPSTGTSDLIAINATVSGSNIHDNLNRGVYARGANASITVSTSTFTGNGSNPASTGSSLAVFASGNINVSNSFFTNPGSGTVSTLFAQQNGTITARDNSLDQNSNGSLTEIQTGGTVDMSRNWLGETNEATIGGIVDLSSDFTPWIASGTDTDVGAAGFQPDLSNLIVGPTGAQTSGERTQEGHDMVDVDGTVTLLLSDYTDSLIVTRNVFFDPEANTTIDNIAMDGGNLSLLADLEINDSLALSTGILDVDLDDGDRSNDPIIILNNPVSGTGSFASHVEGKIQAALDGVDPFEFPVGDAGAYRPVILDPTNASTFTVAHAGEVAPIGGGSFGDMRDLHGEVSAELGGTIQSTLATRYWEIDVVSGTPGDTDVTLEITSGDEASDASTLGMLRFDGTNWLEMTHVNSAGSDPFVITGRTNTFSDFSIYSTDASANPLPVELLEFNGTMKGRDIMLTWSTVTEVNSDYFQVEHSTDGQFFEPVGSVDSHGNSNERHDYHFVDMNVESGVHYYRLQIVDFNGAFEYSPTIQVVPDFSDARVMIYPNPTTDFIKIEGIEASYLKQLAFYDLSGKLHQTITSLDASQIQVSDLPEGHYLIRLEMVDGSLFEGKLVVK